MLVSADPLYTANRDTIVPFEFKYRVPAGYTPGPNILWPAGSRPTAPISPPAMRRWAAMPGRP
jgi:hypothetical protein